MVFSITSLTVVYCVLTRHTKVLTHTRDTSFFIKGCREEDGWVEKGVELGRWDINIWIINSPDRPPKFSLPLCLWWESVQSSQRWNNGGEGSTGAAMSHPHTRTLANSVNMQTHSHMLSTLMFRGRGTLEELFLRKSYLQFSCMASLFKYFTPSNNLNETLWSLQKCRDWQQLCTVSQCLRHTHNLIYF